MFYYDYVVKDPVSTKKVRGVITADDAESASQNLKARGLIVLEISSLKDFLHLRKIFYDITYRITKKDIKEFFEQLSFMLGTNLQMYNALIILRDYSVNKKLRYLAKPIAESIRKGLPLHEALEETKFFQTSVIMQVKSGEESADVPNSLKRLAEQYTRELEFMAKIKNAMTYPILITVVMIGVLWVLMTMVVPTLAKTISSLGGELPLITKIVIGASKFMSATTPVLIVLIIACIIGFKHLCKQEGFKYQIDSLELKIPLIGNLIAKLEMSRFCRNLSAMQNSGITLVRSLNITKTAIKNSYMKKAIEKTAKMVEISGVNLSTALSKAGNFPELMVQLIEVGVNAGQISDVLEKIANQYENEIDNSIKRITGLIEPIMIIIVGLIAGTIVLAMMSPLFSIIDVL